MKKWLKVAAYALGGLVGILAVAALVLILLAGSRLNKHYDPPVEAVSVPSDSASVDRGHHLVTAVSLCVGCHKEDLSGGNVFDVPNLATVNASNLTPGRGGVGSFYTDEDFVRAIRHGVNSKGRGLIVMHSDAYHNFSKQDLADIVAYLESLPAVDHDVPPTTAKPLGKIMIALGMFDNPSMPLIPAEVIDQNAPFVDAPAPGVTPEYGQYLISVALCRMCHGRELTGGPPIDEGAPAGPNIAMYGGPDGWPKEAFIETIRTGVTPYGRSLTPDHMPWKFYSLMTDDELGAIWMYLASLNGR